jgi:hypothetical protein
LATKNKLVKHVTIYKLLFICIGCTVCAFAANAQQRASEKPLSAFYSPAMQKKMATTTPQLRTTDQRRASEKPLDAFLSPEMKSRLDARTPRPSVPASVPRASQKPLAAFYSKAMREHIQSRPQRVTTAPARTN